MANTDKVVQDVLIEPLESVLLHAGKGIVQAQLELDKNSLATQVMFDNETDLSQSGIRASWYQFSEVSLELRLALSLQATAEMKDGKIRARGKQLFCAPMNATYKNLFNYDVNGASTIRAKIVTVPPAGPARGA